MLRVFASRWLNVQCGGSPDEMLCTRVHRECWRIEPIIDFIIFWHQAHCARCFNYERRTNAKGHQVTTAETQGEA